ncbi:MAG: sulfur carrier protein ThiS [Polyangiaceae bacterium]
MNIVLNGEPRALTKTPMTIADLVAELAPDGPVAVEKNGDVIPRAEHASTVLAEGDNIEVVHFVGGG